MTSLIAALLAAAAILAGHGQVAPAAISSHSAGVLAGAPVRAAAAPSTAPAISRVDVVCYDPVTKTGGYVYVYVANWNGNVVVTNAHPSPGIPGFVAIQTNAYLIKTGLPDLTQPILSSGPPQSGVTADLTVNLLGGNGTYTLRRMTVQSFPSYEALPAATTFSVAC